VPKHDDRLIAAITRKSASLSSLIVMLPSFRLVPGLPDIASRVSGEGATLGVYNDGAKSGVSDDVGKSGVNSIRHRHHSLRSLAPSFSV
jgi:hypothetical protein